MKLSDKFLLHKANGETILVPTGSASFSGIVKGNATLGKVLELLKSETTEEKLIEDMKAIYEGPSELIEADVKKVISKLREIGALDG